MNQQSTATEENVNHDASGKNDREIGYPMGITEADRNLLIEAYLYPEHRHAGPPIRFPIVRMGYVVAKADNKSGYTTLNTFELTPLGIEMGKRALMSTAIQAEVERDQSYDNYSRNMYLAVAAQWASHPANLKTVFEDLFGADVQVPPVAEEPPVAEDTRQTDD